MENADKLTFSTERDGEAYDVDVPIETIQAASESGDMTGEERVFWLQTNMDELYEIAHRKLDSGERDAGSITITSADWQAK